MDDYRPDVLLCVVAHPDDIDVLIGGAIARWVEQGTKVCSLICTDGGNGTSEKAALGSQISSTRAKEQHKANTALGIACCHQLDIADGTVSANDDLRREIVRAIRGHKPDAVFTMDPTFWYDADSGYVNHRDHRAVGEATFDAVYPMARDIGSFPDLAEEGFEPHEVSLLLMANMGKENFYVDITNSFERKCEALRAHESQFGDGSAIIEHVETRARACGELAACELAEGFVKLRVM